MAHSTVTALLAASNINSNGATARVIPGHQLARQIAETLSRAAGLFTAHQMMESPDPRYHSELAQSLMVECERLLDGSIAGATNG